MNLKRSFSVILSLGLILTLFQFLPTRVKATDVALGLRAGYYYRIKNVQTGYYLTIANSSDVRKAQISPDDVLSTDALIEKANAIASELVMNSSAFSVNTEMSAINETKADIVLTCTVSDYVFDAAVIELAQNGSVKKLQFEYCDVPADFTPAALDAVLEDYLLEKVAATYGEDHTDFEISHGYFMSLNNMIYGAYSVTMEGKELLDTFGIYINKISDMEYREELLKVLIPMQHEVENAAFSEDEDMEETEDVDMTMYDD